MSKRFRFNTGGGLEICGHAVDVFKNSLIPREVSNIIETLNGIGSEVVCDVVFKSNNFREFIERRRYHLCQVDNVCEGFSRRFTLLSKFTLMKSSHFEIELFAELKREDIWSNEAVIFSVMKVTVSVRSG